MAFPGTPYQHLIYKRTYSRYIDELGRREEWDESVERYRDFMLHILVGMNTPLSLIEEFKLACESVLSMDVMPSMRALWTAGPALERENVAGYNCAYLEVNHPRKFAELLYILMNGTGCGFTVERQIIQDLPKVPCDLSKTEDTIEFADSKKGWSEGYYQYLRSLWSGSIPKYDLSSVRPKGSRLKTFGGRASGPEPLQELLEYTKALFYEAKGRNLNSLECHDLCCRIASVVMVGGVRRSACISLSNLSDDRMAKAKSGDWWQYNPSRQFANNSVAYTEKPESRKFLSEWLKLVESQSGERGIFNRQGAEFAVIKTGRREPGYTWGTNPCGEIILRPDEFCNLTEVVVRKDDSLETLRTKVQHATILGVVQSLLTDFKFLSRSWKKNCEQERLLGVSLTGLMDHPYLNHVHDDSALEFNGMKHTAVLTATRWAKGLNIPVPAAITCVKPSGTVSQLVGSSSGLHTRYAPFYIRRVQVSADDPVSKLLIDSGVPHQAAPGENNPDNPSTWSFEFPIKSPEKSICKDQVNAVQQLEYWKLLKENWTEHNPSCTIYVKDDEWVGVGAWVHQHWNQICGLTFLPVDKNIYVRPPYEEIDEELHSNLSDALPPVDFDRLSEFEKGDHTEGSREFACVSGACEL
jgi:ribonucleoside-triphosphate reductase (thioredoxin)